MYILWGYRILLIYFYTVPTPPTYDDAFAGTQIVQRYDKAARLPVHQAKGEGHRLPLREHAKHHPAQDDPLLVQPRHQLVEAHVTQRYRSAAARRFVEASAVGAEILGGIDGLREAGELFGLELALEVDERADVLQVFDEVAFLASRAFPRGVQGL